MILLRTPRQMLYYMGLLSLVGLACGALTGVVADSVIRHLGRIGWKAQAERRSGLVPVLISVIVVAAVGVWAWTSLPRVSPAGVTVTVQQGTPELLELDQLPLAP